ncbi:hypothetical protein Tco_0390132 [Tanacetum coccineum]
MWFCFGDNLCAYDYYVNIMWYDCACMHRGAGQGAYDLGVATPRALVYVGLMTSGDARSWYMISGDAKCGLIKAPPSPDYVSGPEYPPLPDFVLEPVYPEFMLPEDEVLPAEEQPLPAAVSPIADSPGYVPESDPKEDPEEDDDEDPKEDPDDYPTNGGDDSDDEDESSDDDEDDDVDIERMRRRRSTQLMPTLHLLLYQLLIMPHLLRRLSHLRPTSLRPHHHHILYTGLLLGYQSEISHIRYFGLIQRLPDSLAIPTPPPSPLSLWSSPYSDSLTTNTYITSTITVSTTYPLGYTSAIDPARAEALYIH